MESARCSTVGNQPSNIMPICPMWAQSGYDSCSGVLHGSLVLGPHDVMLNMVGDHWLIASLVHYDRMGLMVNIPN